MFGADPDLVCPDCARQVREKYAHRVGPRIGHHRPILTSAFIAAAAALFVAAHAVKPTPEWISAIVAGPEVWVGETWRLATTAFLHAGPAFGASWTMGIVHILFNCWWLRDLGRAIEGAWGPLAILGLVVGTAIAASAAQWITTGPGIGLSGVVFGLAGFLFALRRVHPVAAALMNPGMVNALVGWFILCVILTQMGSLPIANWAHGGGAVWGLAAGYAVGSRHRRVWIPVLAVLTVGLMLAAQFVAFGERAVLRAEWLRWHAASE